MGEVLFPFFLMMAKSIMITEGWKEMQPLFILNSKQKHFMLDKEISNFFNYKFRFYVDNDLLWKFLIDLVKLEGSFLTTMQ